MASVNSSKPAGRRAGAVPDGHRVVKISYSPNPEDVGTTRTVPADEARILVEEGRARYADLDQGDAEPAAESAPNAG